MNSIFRIGAGFRSGPGLGLWYALHICVSCCSVVDEKVVGPIYSVTPTRLSIVDSGDGGHNINESRRGGISGDMNVVHVDCLDGVEKIEGRVVETVDSRDRAV